MRKGREGEERGEGDKDRRGRGRGRERQQIYGYIDKERADR